MRPYRHRLRFQLIAGGLFVLALAGGCDRGSRPTLVGSTAPDFTVTDGPRSVTLSHLRGHIVLLNFWATWCAPCIEEIPSLESLQKQMPQIKVLAVSTDRDNDAYNQFMTEHQLGFDNIRDASWHSNLLYGTQMFPETYIIDRNGVVRRRFIGPVDWASPAIMDYLKKL
jgi:thiol-disulfide isomerase/thioredoxin